MLHNSDLLQKTLATVALLEEPMFKNSTSKNDILTPWSVVEKHMTDIFGDIEDIVFTEDSKILEIGAYNGYYAVYCAKKIFEKTGKPYEKILKENIFIATRKVFSEYYIQKILGKDLECNLATFNILENDVNLLTGPLWGLGENELKFTAIVGNPPYQTTIKKVGLYALPIYTLFTEAALKLSSRYLSLVIPARWYSSGKDLDAFRNSMLSKNNIEKIYDFEDARELFAEIDLKGGICYFLINSTYKGSCAFNSLSSCKLTTSSRIDLSKQGYDFLVRDTNASSILEKLPVDYNFSTLVSVVSPFGLPTSFTGFSVKCDENVLLYKFGGQEYTSLDNIKKNIDAIYKYKVYLPEASGSGRDKKILASPILGNPNTGCTATYLMIGPFDTEDIAQNCISYIKTKFFRYLVSLKKLTHHGSKKVYELVPLVDLNESWTDEKLYKKFGLTEEDILAIENKIDPMD